MKLTDKPCVAGGRAVHALQGGGPGMIIGGRVYYVKGVTWCGVERGGRCTIEMVETTAAPTCRTCLRALAAHEAREERNETL